MGPGWVGYRPPAVDGHVAANPGTAWVVRLEDLTALGGSDGDWDDRWWVGTVTAYAGPAVVSVTTDSLTVDEGTVARLTLQRTGDTSEQLTVVLEASMYDPAPGVPSAAAAEPPVAAVVEFEPGAATTTLAVVVEADDDTTPRALQVAVLPGEGYAVGGTDTAIVRVTEAPEVAPPPRLVDPPEEIPSYIFWSALYGVFLQPPAEPAPENPPQPDVVREVVIDNFSDIPDKVVREFVDAGKATWHGEAAVLILGGSGNKLVLKREVQNSVRNIDPTGSPDRRYSGANLLHSRRVYYRAVAIVPGTFDSQTAADLYVNDEVFQANNRTAEIALTFLLHALPFGTVADHVVNGEGSTAEALIATAGDAGMLLSFGGTKLVGLKAGGTTAAAKRLSDTGHAMRLAGLSLEGGVITVRAAQLGSDVARKDAVAGAGHLGELVLRLVTLRSGAKKLLADVRADAARVAVNLTKPVIPVPEGHTRVYRAVSEAEYQQLARSGKFEQGPNALEGKWFWESVESAERFGASNMGPGPGKFRVIEADVSDSAPSLYRVPKLDNIGPARYLSLEDLTGVVPRPSGGS